MSIIQTVKRYFGTEPETVQLFSCKNCSNLFTKAGEETECDESTCPNCQSGNVELAVP